MDQLRRDLSHALWILHSAIRAIDKQDAWTKRDIADAKRAYLEICKRNWPDDE